jgi:pimeloyl-ACP methyl ester carboxylesterase
MTAGKTIIEVEGHKVYLTENPGRPLMVLIRMAAGGMGLWDNIWPYLNRYFTVGSIDLPPVALDQFPSSRELFKHMANTVVKVVKGMKYDRFHLFGWTGGAQVGLRCLVDYPTLVQSAVLMGAVYLPEERRPMEKANAILKVILDHGDLELYTYYWLLTQHTPDYSEQHFDRIKALVEARLKADTGRLDTQRVLKWIKAIREQAASDEELEGIYTPTLLVAPAFESFPRLPHLRRLNAKIKTSELAVIPGGGAMVLQEAPEKFMAAAGRFLRAAASGKIPSTKLSEKNTVTVVGRFQRTDILENSKDTAIVFLHGWLMSPHMWAYTMEALKGKARCLAFWQPGHGKTTALGTNATMEQWADWVIQNLDELNVKTCVLVGHSMGGMVTLNAALKYPHRVKGIVLVSTEDTVWDEEKREGFLQAVDTVAVAWGPEMGQQVADLLLGEKFLKSYPAWLGAWINEVSGYDLAGIANLGKPICYRPDVSEKMKEIKVPTLVVHGTVDKAIDINVGRDMAARIPGASFVEMPGAAHCPPLEVPEFFTKTLINFLREKNLIEK